MKCQVTSVFDVLVLGSGISGLAAAVTAAEAGCSVCVISKESDFLESNTYYAQGGIVGDSPEDTQNALARDINRAGNNLNYRRAVKLIASEGAKALRELLVEKAGVPFGRDEKGNFLFTREAAHSVRRILYVKDTTGKSIQEHLLNYAKNLPNIDFYHNCIAVDIITNTHHSKNKQERYRTSRAFGAYVLDEETGDVIPFFAHNTVIATGGIGNIFRHTSNPEGSTGDGIAMAYRTGAEIINAEYIQFHPTILYHRDVKRFLISEALRGEGARLMNIKGEYFMERYHPGLKDLAPRDEVARAIYRELEASHTDYVLLDTRKINEVSAAERFPGIAKKCKQIGINIETDPVPVVPAAHYFCGGIKTDLNGATSIEGLYAVGETACTGVHGANRLASVSLLEGLYFGRSAGEHISKGFKPLSNTRISDIPGWIYPEVQESFDPVLIQHDMLNLQLTMWNYVGIIRTKRRLERALSDLNYLKHRVNKFYRGARLNRGIVELRNSIQAAIVIAGSAASNNESLGCHYIRERK